MVERHIMPGQLDGKVTDVHTHVGINLQMYLQGAFPPCQSLEGLAAKQAACGVDLSVTFAYSADLHFDIGRLREGVCAATDAPVSPVPYASENRMLFREVFEWCPELAGRFLPFLCADPGRDPGGQVEALAQIVGRYPAYGVKVSPVSVQSPLADLLGAGKPIVEFAAAHDLPMLFHVTTHAAEKWSRPEVALELAERWPGMRFCLAHCIGFDRELLELADGLANVWVDTSALKIQVEMVHDGNEVMAAPGRRFETDYSDHLAVMRDLAEAFPSTILWGSDSPAYSYVCDRRQSDDSVVSFRLKGTYEAEVAALNALPVQRRRAVSAINTRNFLFGKGDHAEDA